MFPFNSLRMYFYSRAKRWTPINGYHQNINWSTFTSYIPPLILPPAPCCQLNEQDLRIFIYNQSPTRKEREDKTQKHQSSVKQLFLYDGFLSASVKRNSYQRLLSTKQNKHSSRPKWSFPLSQMREECILYQDKNKLRNSQVINII